MKYILVLAAVLLFYTCNTGREEDVKDFSVTYFTRNALMQYELNAVIDANKLKLNYNNYQQYISGGGEYKIKDSESEEIYNYLKTIGFLKMRSPEPEMVLDAAEQNIKASYDDKTNTVDFGSVTSPPIELINIKNMILGLASKYDRNFKTDAGW